MNCSWNSEITWHNAVTSALRTFSILGSATGFSRISCGFALLLRLGNGFTELVSFLWVNRGSEGIKMGLDGLFPFGEIGDGIRGGVIGSNSDAICGGFSSIKFEGSNGRAIEIIGDSSDVFEFIGHSAVEK